MTGKALHPPPSAGGAARPVAARCARIVRGRTEPDGPVFSGVRTRIARRLSAVFSHVLPQTGRGCGLGPLFPVRAVGRGWAQVRSAAGGWCRSALRFRLWALRQAFPAETPVRTGSKRGARR